MHILKLTACAVCFKYRHVFKTHTETATFLVSATLGCKLLSRGSYALLQALSVKQNIQ